MTDADANSDALDREAVGLLETHPRAPLPLPHAPSWSWALRRAGLGLAIMLAVTSFAAIIAQASIDSAPEQPLITTPPEISIGTPAAALLRR